MQIEGITREKIDNVRAAVNFLRPSIEEQAPSAGNDEAETSEKGAAEPSGPAAGQEAQPLPAEEDNADTPGESSGENKDGAS